jgi:glycosyltransferase involved in cell wall biosynthesis
MENKKKYIVISPLFPNDNSHVGSYVYDQVKAIIDLSDYNVKVIKVTSLFSSEKDYNFKGIEVKVFKVFDLPFFIFPGLFNWVNAIRIKQFFKAHNLVAGLAVIHAHVCYPSAYLANSIATVLNVRTMIQHHGIDALQLLNGRLSFITKVQKKILRNRSLKQLNKIDLNISVSNRVKNELHLCPNYFPKQEYVLYNGVDRTKFYNMNVIKSTDKFYVGCIANFWPIKDHINLIKAVGLLVKEGVDDIVLRLIGTGEMFDFCKQYVIDHNLSSYILFEKERKHSELNIFYNQLDLFVLPSYYEALGCVSLEAWAVNIPVISIQGQGFAELVAEDEKNNLLAQKISPESLKEKIFGEYTRKRKYPFNEMYDIKNTISAFIDLPFFDIDN